MLEGVNDFQSKVIYCLSILDILVFSEHLLTADRMNTRPQKKLLTPPLVSTYLCIRPRRTETDFRS